mmetsp:Transcript_12892/g.38946  ORF Transcript_12892/g.38946 Transcript_12892/m.38946 type:complete len:258 (-) Transcript_12892:471-1244(-)
MHASATHLEAVKKLVALMNMVLDSDSARGTRHALVAMDRAAAAAGTAAATAPGCARGLAASQTSSSVAARAGMLPHLRRTTESSPSLLITIVAAAAATPIAVVAATLPPSACSSRPQLMQPMNHSHWRSCLAEAGEGSGIWRQCTVLSPAATAAAPNSICRGKAAICPADTAWPRRTSVQTPPKAWAAMAGNSSISVKTELSVMNAAEPRSGVSQAGAAPAVEAAAPACDRISGMNDPTMKTADSHTRRCVMMSVSV